MVRSSPERDEKPGRGAPIVALLRERRARVRLQRAVGGEHWLSFVERWSRLYDAARERPVGLFVLDPRDERGELQADAVARLARHHPSIAVLLYLPFGAHLADPLLRWGRLGVHHVAFLDLGDSTLYLHEMVDRALARSATEALWARLRAALEPIPVDVARALRVGLHRLVEIHSAEDWADVVGAPLRSFYRVFERARMPSPKRCLEWLRLLHVVQRLGDPGSGVEEITRSIGWTPPERRVREWAESWGVEPSDLWYTVPLDAVIEVFALECREGGLAPRRRVAES